MPPATEPPPPATSARRPAWLWPLTLVAVAASLARRADGTPFLPLALEWSLEAPLALGWWFAVGRRGGVAERLWIGAGGAASAAIAFGTRRVDLLGVGLSLFIAATLLLGAAAGIAARLAEPRGGFGATVMRTVAAWLALVLVGTALLALPVATLSAVPDYRYNFWRHVVQCAYTAAGSACLVGVSAFDLRGDFSPFGRLVLLVLMQAGGLAALALGCAGLRPLLKTMPRLSTLVAVGAGIELSGAALVFAAGAGGAAAERAGWSLLHAACAFLNCGLPLPTFSQAFVLERPVVFVTTTALAILGSLGLPMLVTGATGSVRRRPAATVDAAALHGSLAIAGREIAAAFWLLIAGATVLFFCETPGLVPRLFVPERPLELATDQTPLAELSFFTRWRGALFISAAARSAGTPVAPLSEGAINWVTLAVLCGLMWMGGSAGSFSGGIRTTTLFVIGRRLFPGANRHARPAAKRTPAVAPSTEPSAALVGRRLLGLPAVMAVLAAAAVGSLGLWHDATWWERTLDGVGAATGVGWTSGLAAHLTWPARCAMIVAMMLGKLVPLLWWVWATQPMASDASETPG